MEDLTTIITTISVILLGFSALATWAIKTTRQVIHDANAIVVEYKLAKADKKLTLAERGVLLDKLETLFKNLGKNTKKLLRLNLD